MSGKESTKPMVGKEMGEEGVIKEKVKANQIRFLKEANIYEPFIAKPSDYPKGLFESTVNFFSDLVELSRILVGSMSKREDLTLHLAKVN